MKKKRQLKCTLSASYVRAFSAYVKRVCMTLQGQYVRKLCGSVPKKKEKKKLSASLKKKGGRGGGEEWYWR